MRGFDHNYYCTQSIRKISVLLLKISTKANIWYQSTIIILNKHSVKVLNKYSVEPEIFWGKGVLQLPNPPVSTPTYWGLHFNINIDPNQ